MIRRVFKRLGLAKDFNVPFLMITNESTISSIFGMWAMALEYIDKSSCSAHPVPLHHADNENSAFHDTACGFLDSFFAIEKTSAEFRSIFWPRASFISSNNKEGLEDPR